MKKSLIIIGILLLLTSGLVSAQEHSLEEAKALIDSKVSCDELTDEQLEVIGDYYMEQMHPGEAHELMDEMMGGEGSETLRQMHINMAKRLYCNEDIGGMMGMMASSDFQNKGGMMNMMAGYGMMGSSGYGFWHWNFFNVLCVILLIGLIILIYLGIIKLWRDLFKKKR